MKIQTRDAGLLALGFIIGAIITVTLTSTPGPVPAPASRVVATGPVLAAASLPSQLVITTNFVIQLPPLRGVMLDNSFDSQSPLPRRVRPALDLIDTRYQPEIKLEDLR